MTKSFTPTKRKQVKWVRHKNGSECFGGDSSDHPTKTSFSPAQVFALTNAKKPYSGMKISVSLRQHQHLSLQSPRKMLRPLRSKLISGDI